MSCTVTHAWEGMYMYIPEAWTSVKMFYTDGYRGIFHQFSDSRGIHHYITHHRNRCIYDVLYTQPTLNTRNHLYKHQSLGIVCNTILVVSIKDTDN